jgi:DNA repair protein RadC
MNIHQWPEQDRPREKLLNLGAHALTDSELLAILINCGTTRLNAVDLARQLMTRHKDLNALFDVPSKELYETPGIGPAKYVLFQTIKEIAARLLTQSYNKKYIRTGADAKNHFIKVLGSRKHEAFACLFLGYEQQILGAQILSEGTINTTEVHAREVAKRALRYNATTVILGHNHPTGVARPSPSDIRTTIDLRRLLAPLEVHIVDHIVVVGHEAFSFSENGLI